MKSKKKTPLPIAMIAGGLVAVLLVVGLAWQLFRDHEPAPAEEAVGRAVADRFLSELQAKRAGAAWELTTAEFKSDEGREAFIRWAAQRPVLATPLEFQEFRVSEFNGLHRSEFVYRPPVGTKPEALVHVVVGQDFGEWKIERVDID